MFLREGPAVSTARIAQALGVSQAALFKRVATKQQLLRRALIGGDIPAWIVDIEQGPSQASVQTQLLHVARKVDAFYAALMPAASTLKAAGMCVQDIFGDLDPPPPLRAQHALTLWLQTLHNEERVCAPRPRAVAIAFLGAIQARHAMRHFMGPDYPDGGETYIEELAELFWRGLNPTPSA